MTKQKMAEWLAQELLGWEKVATFNLGDQTWKVADNSHVHCDSIAEEIYSPDGFFAVWDAIEEKGFYISQAFPVDGLYYFDISLPFDDGGNLSLREIKQGEGKDRYEAFYNAVYEAIKTPAD